MLLNQKGKVEEILEKNCYEDKFKMHLSHLPYKLIDLKLPREMECFANSIDLKAIANLF